MLFLCVAGFAACVYEAELKPGKNDVDFSVSDARDFFEKNADEFNLSDLISPPEEAVRSGELPDLVLTPLWQTAKTYDAEHSDVVNVPIMTSSLLLVRRHDNKDSLPTHSYNMSLESRLVVEKQPDGSVKMYTTTLVPDYSYLLGRREESRYLHPDNDFTGMVIRSSLDGVVEDVWYYKDGVRLYPMDAVRELPEGTTDYIRLDGQEPWSPRSFAGTRSSSEENRPQDKIWGDLNPNCETCVKYGYACEEHGYWTGDAVVIGKKPKPSYPPFFYIPQQPPPPPPPTIPIGPGGTGGPGGGNPGDQNQDQNPTSDQRTPKQITDAVKKSVDGIIQSDNPPGSMTAKCNFGVRDAFKNFTNNSTELNNMRANDMVKHWQSSPNWQSISMSQAQDLANQGYFVVAGKGNPSGSGHVVVVVPGTATTQNWNGGSASVPNVMDTGLRKRTKSQPINYSWGTKDHSGIEFYKYK